MKKPRAKLAPTIPGIFIQAVAREPDHKVPAGEFPFSVPAIRHLTTLAFTTPVTFFVGEPSRTGSRSFPWSCIGCEATACTSSTSLRFALSPTRQMALLAAMHRLVQRNSQFIIATHSPILLGFPGATIHLFSERAMTHTAYLDTEHYQITKAFLDNPERMLKELLRADDPSEERV